MASDPNRDGRIFHTLDALRGVAALIVVTRHEVRYFAPVYFDQAWAVDMFFVLSGFVLAKSYGERLRTTMRFKDFVLTRVIRLYPLYVLGSLIGVANAVAAGMPLDAVFALHLLLAALMLPEFIGPVLFPFNGPAWSLFFELAANYGWAQLVRRALDRLVPLIVGLSAGGLVAFSLMAGHLDLGWQASNFVAGLPRVCYSFGLGVLMWRHGHRIKLPHIPHWLLLAAAVALMWLPSPAAFKGAYSALMVLIVVPALVLFATRTEPRGRLAEVYKVLGVISYGVYVLHMPVGEMINAIGLAHGVHPEAYAPWNGIPFLLLVSGLAWLATAIYDAPVRAWLTRRTRRSGRAGAAKAAAS